MWSKLQILLIITVILCSSCISSEDFLLEARFHTQEYLPEYDMQPDYAVSGGSVCRKDKVYYYKPFYNFNYIYYYDETSGISGKVCGKAECTHHSRECNAFCNSPCGIQIYDGMLYFIENDALYRMDLSGNRREKVMFLRSMEGMNAKFALHRGYIYTSVVQDIMQEGKPQMRFTLCQQILGQTETKKIIIDKTMAGTAVEKWLIQGNHLYLALDDCRTEDMLFTNEFYRYDIGTDELDSLRTDYTEWGIIGMRTGHASIEMIQKSIQNGIRISRYDWNTKKISEPFQLQAAGSMGFIILSEEQILEYSSIGKLEYKLSDRKGSVIRKGVLPEPSSASKHTSLIGDGSDSEGFLVEMLNFDTGEARLLRIPYDGTEVQILIYLLETEA